RPDRDRVQPARPGHDRRRRPGPASAEHPQRHDRHGRFGVPRPDDRLRPLPRPQIRAPAAGRLLPAASVLRPGRVPARPGDRAGALAKHRPITRPTRAAIAQLEEPYRKKLYDARLARLSDEAQKAHRTPEAERTSEQQGLVALTDRLITVSAKEVANAMSAED